jgi:hypothetical protein
LASITVRIWATIFFLLSSRLSRFAAVNEGPGRKSTLPFSFDDSLNTTLAVSSLGATGGHQAAQTVDADA